MQKTKDLLNFWEEQMRQSHTLRVTTFLENHLHTIT